MKSIRTRVAVVVASSAVLASGLSVVAVAASSATAAAVPVADGASSSTSSVPDITVYDP